HLTIARRVLALLQQHKAGDIKVLIGGIIPEEDRKQLIELGVAEVFTPKNSDLAEIVQQITAVCSEKGSSE
ncbi:MAG: hypothetical protein JO189_28540, partial [Deltaproteobacteria bacterium]|nr:hypothetical protein [Deltaproteobacteria bacterium]